MSEGSRNVDVDSSADHDEASSSRTVVFFVVGVGARRALKENNDENPRRPSSMATATDGDYVATMPTVRSVTRVDDE